MGFSFKMSMPSRSAKPDGDDATVMPQLLASPLDRRLISGERMLCRCSFELPNENPFSSYRVKRHGYMIMNVRGGSFYMFQPMSEETARKTFPSGQASMIKRFTLHPADEPVIPIGDIGARFLKIAHGDKLSGMVLRFSGLNEQQLDLLNSLAARFPVVDGSEEDAIPMDELRRLEGLDSK